MTRVSDLHIPCEMFALCRNDADGVADTGLHVLGVDGFVPVCQRCADRLGYQVIDAEVEVERVDPNGPCVESTGTLDCAP